MSLNRLEQVTYDLGVKAELRKRFAKDPERLLDGYYLDDAEKRMLLEFDVRKLIDCGISPVLTMGFWMMTEPSHSMKNYLLKVNNSL